MIAKAGIRLGLERGGVTISSQDPLVLETVPVNRVIEMHDGQIAGDYRC